VTGDQVTSEKDEATILNEEFKGEDILLRIPII
jgi:hypothetical protein